MTLDRIVQDTLSALRFYSRLPIPTRSNEPDAYGPPDMDQLAYAIPLAGAAMGAMGGVTLVAAVALGFPPFLCAALALSVMVLASGAIHEDGLADTADGWGGGRDKEKRLAIMRDSRVGSFGAVALVLSLLLRLGAISALMVASDPVRAGLVLVAGAAASRAMGIALLRALPPARTDGASAAFGQPSAQAVLACLLMAALIVAVILVPLFGVGATFAGLIGLVLSFYVMIGFSRRLLGGQTGDVSGATQQISEIAFLLAVLIYA
ncbi:adenosylcobinamide-GDP ribazoletransferase [Xanthobacter sp. TB0139]|uniref:adenosylcobinamide-GDP ribazoletransferase n=1 Tax=Xanthobacter sp. TB0139 TaxID=3459178 RepID=UPI00403A60D4